MGGNSGKAKQSSGENMGRRRGKGLWRALAAGAALLGCIAGWQAPVVAASDNTVNPWAADYMSLALPEGTFAALSYTAWRYLDEYIQNSNNIFGKVLDQPVHMSSDFGVVTQVARFAYLTKFFDHPLALEAAIPYVGVVESQLGTVSPVTVNDGVRDLFLFFDYGLIVDPKNERFLDFTNHFVVPTGNYDKFKVVNVSTPNQFTDIPMIALCEGFAKYGIPNFWLDIYANAAFHSDGDAPVAIRGVGQYDKLTQENSYDVWAFLRYQFATFTWAAIGIEKSWGGKQTASGGVLGAVFGPTSLGEDEYTKGHFQAQYPVAQDFHVALDITHDFDRVGGLREDFTAELRLVKLFIPAPAPAGHEPQT
jgi:hypothetical protein